MNDISRKRIQIGTNICTEENHFYFARYHSFLFSPALNLPPSAMKASAPDVMSVHHRDNPHPAPPPHTVLKSPVSVIHTVRIIFLTQDHYAVVTSRLKLPLHLACFASFHGEIMQSGRNFISTPNIMGDNYSLIVEPTHDCKRNLLHMMLKDN